MAGDSRILINDQGITISTEGKIVYQAGQHKFEGGQQVVSEIYKLPDAPTDYSLKFKYTSNLPNQVGKLTKTTKHAKRHFWLTDVCTCHGLLPSHSA